MSVLKKIRKAIDKSQREKGYLKSYQNYGYYLSMHGGYKPKVAKLLLLRTIAN